MLLKANANVNYASDIQPDVSWDSAQSLLTRVVEKNLKDADMKSWVSLLVDSNADVDFRSAQGRTALMLASTVKDKLTAVKTLLDAKASVDAKDNSGCTALLLACVQTHVTSEASAVTVVQTLLDAKADPRLSNTSECLKFGPDGKYSPLPAGMVSLVQAAEWAPDLGMLLLSAGMSPSVKDGQGQVEMRLHAHTKC